LIASPLVQHSNRFEHAWHLRRFSAEMSMLEQSSRPMKEAPYMIKKFMCAVAIGSAMGAVTLFAQEVKTKPGEGTLMLEKKTYPLKHALAYETTIDNEPAIVVVLSGQAVFGEKLKETKKAEKGGWGRRFRLAISQASL
jgi:hypothetical protein